jgi:glycosyltransferase involved in cell wall biosynthesis
LNKRVAFFLTSPSGGGAERAMISVANYLVDNGWQVDVVFGRPNGPYRANVDSRASIFDLNVDRLRGMMQPMHRYMRERKPDVVLSALTPCDLVMLFGRMLLGWKARLIISIQNHPVEVGRQGGRRLDRFWPFFVRHFYGRADCVSGISGGVAVATAGLLGVDVRKVPVIPNPVIAPGFAQLLQEAPEHPWFHDSGPPVVLAAGRLTKQKDYPTLLRAFKLLLQRRSARLVIIGDGEERKELERLARDLGISEHLAMPGFIGNPYCWMRCAQLFVLSSRWEGFANVVAEALACGVPVVSTDCPSGPGEILASGDFGRLVQVGDANALAQAMDESLDAQVQHERLVARGMEYSVSKIAPRYVDLIHKVLAP